MHTPSSTPYSGAAYRRRDFRQHRARREPCAGHDHRSEAHAMTAPLTFNRGYRENPTHQSLYNAEVEDSMGRLHAHSESHLVDGIGWLRTVLLGANDGSSRRRAHCRRRGGFEDLHRCLQFEDVSTYRFTPQNASVVIITPLMQRTVNVASNVSTIAPPAGL